MAGLLVGCSEWRQAPAAYGADDVPASPPQGAYGFASSPGAAAAVAFATSRLGTPYCWGGAGPSCYDCSGLTHAAWLRGGKAIPRTSTAQAERLPGVPLQYAMPGDILWRPGHVALYVGGGYVIAAPGTGDVVRYQVARNYQRALRP